MQDTARKPKFQPGDRVRHKIYPSDTGTIASAVRLENYPNDRCYFCELRDEDGVYFVGIYFEVELEAI